MANHRAAEQKQNHTPAADLAALTPTRHREITRWLAIHRRENYLVTEDCRTIYTDRPQARNTHALSSMLQQLGNPPPQVVFTDTATFSTLNELRSEVAAGTAADESSETVGNLEYLFADAIRQGASDIHLRIRQQSRLLYRIDGLLLSQREYSRRVGLCFARTVFNYFARTSQDFSENLPLDGAFDFRHDGDRFGIRANLMPEVRGCTMVIRIRRPRNTIALSEAGYHPRQYQLICRAMRRSSGLVLFSGPTNSGKSTAMSNLLAEVSVERNVVSIEDPVELRLPHVAHVDLSAHAELVSAESLLGCTVRQDPDLLALAEIRDEKTARFAENMVLQGRLVLATLHADGVSSIPQRLIKLGLDEGNLWMPGFLALLVNQTLIPRLCLHCSVFEAATAEGEAGTDISRWLSAERGVTLRYRNRAGCTHCRAGIDGRELVAEVLAVDREVRNIVRACDYERMREWISRSGMPDRLEHARQKVWAGLLDPQMAEARLNILE